VESFGSKLAVITGGGSGMGRELAVALAGEGCRLAICDLSEENMAQTVRLASAARSDVVVSTHLCDVSDEASVLGFRDAVASTHDTDHVHLLFNNAGIGGGGSFVNDAREDWERTFGVCWHGVYYCARAFLPLLIAAEEAHMVNTSSINGFWASIGPDVSHTAYSAAKFAVKGFSEALITDLRLNAPHVGVSVVMPGHIGTNIAANTSQVLGRPAPQDMSAEDIAAVREAMIARGLPVDNQPDEAIRALLVQRGEAFRDEAPTTAAEAAAVILAGVREGVWRILVGDDAHAIDAEVRRDPESAYEAAFVETIAGQGHLQGIVGRLR